MHREIQIKQFPIVTTHWWPKTRNERLCEKTNSIYIVFTSCTQPCPSDLSAHTHPVCDVCVRALWLTLDGGRVWSVVLTQLRGIFLLEDAHCHRSCRFWTVYSRIMMTSFKQAGLLKRSHHYPRVDSSEMTQAMTVRVFQQENTTKLRQHHASDTPSVKRWRLHPYECSVSQSARTHTSHTGCVCALRSLGHGCVQEVKNYINTVRFLTQTARFVS